MVRSRAPGRVNLLGEHTDYNDGFVLPCAIAYDTNVSARARSDAIISAHSQNGAPAFFDLRALPDAPRSDWSDYLCGVLIELRASGVPLCGCEVEITGNVPIGAGLSSSASLEVAFGLAMLALADRSMPPLELALLAQKAEIGFVGTRCGIMDQFAVLHGRAGCALFLDTRSLEYQSIAVPAGVSIVICNTMVKHSLSAGEYNTRRAQCEAAVTILEQHDPDVRALRDVTLEQLESARPQLPSPLFERARHVVSENARVERAAAALRMGDVETFGDLMYESHASLRSDYAVSCEELDAMVGIAVEFPGVFGARMTGGGFGGCTVNLVSSAQTSAFRDYVTQQYHALTGIRPEIYDGTPSDGARILA